MKKKFLALLFAFCFMIPGVILFTACGGNGDGDTPPDETPGQNQPGEETPVEKETAYIYVNVAWDDKNKNYDGEAFAFPSLDEIDTGESTGEVTFEWYAGDVKLESAPVDAGRYELLVKLAETDTHKSAEKTVNYTINKQPIRFEKDGDFIVFEKEYDGDSGYTTDLTAEHGLVDEDLLGKIEVQFTQYDPTEYSDNASQYAKGMFYAKYIDKETGLEITDELKNYDYLTTAEDTVKKRLAEVKINPVKLVVDLGNRVQSTPSHDGDQTLHLWGTQYRYFHKIDLSDFEADCPEKEANNLYLIMEYKDRSEQYKYWAIGAVIDQEKVVMPSKLIAYNGEGDYTSNSNFVIDVENSDLESELVGKVQVLKNEDDTEGAIDAYVKIGGVGLYKDKDCTELLTKADFASWGVNLTAIDFQNAYASTRRTVIDLESEDELIFTSAYGFYNTSTDYYVVVKQVNSGDEATWVSDSLASLSAIAVYE